MALALGLGAVSSPERVTASDDTITTVLRPGLNLAGWIGSAASVEAIFDDIPELDLVYAWDAENQWFVWAVRTDTGVVGNLHMLSPGMGLWLSIAGEQPVSWTRPALREASASSLRQGWNLVAWTGEDGAPATDALRDLDAILTSSADASGREPTSLTRGSALWLNVSAARHWQQPSSDPVADVQAGVEPTLEFLTPVSLEREAEVRALITDVVEFFDDRRVGRVPGLTIRWGDPQRSGCSGRYFRSENAISMSDCTAIFAHEYVHAIQDYLNSDDLYVPHWFSEGSADLWALIYHDYVGADSYTYHFRSIVLELGRGEGFIRSHSEVGFYHSWHARVHLMAKMHGAGVVFDFYRRLSGAGDWQEAFRQSMGMTILEFNVEFAEYALDAPLPREGCPLAPLRPAIESQSDQQEVCTRIAGTVADLTGNPRADVRVVAIRDLLRIGSVNAASTVTGEDGSFSLAVPEGRYWLWLEPQIGQASGLAFVGESGFALHSSEARAFDATGTDIAGITVSSGLVRGIARGSDGAPLSTVAIFLHEVGVPWAVGAGWVFTGSPWSGDGKKTGQFGRLVPPGTYELRVECPDGSDGWYGGENELVSDRSQAARIVIRDADVAGIVINLPFTEGGSGPRSCT